MTSNGIKSSKDFIFQTALPISVKALEDRSDDIQSVAAQIFSLCHKKMNPLGMPFEAYNHVGRYRELELDKPVDTSGEITHTGIAGLDGEVANVREMMERIARSDLARQSFIRHVFRFWMGRNEQLFDSSTLIAMDKAYVDGGGSFKEVLVALLTSDSFLYRK